MKTTIKYFLAITLMLGIGLVAVGTATAGQQPIWHNFISKTATLSGALPSGSTVTSTDPFWQAQVKPVQNAGMPTMAERQASKAMDAMAGNTLFSKPIWCELTKCPQQ